MKRWAQLPESRDQLVLFSRTLDDAIASDSFVRQLDLIMSRLDWSDFEASYQSHRGQPPIHPRILVSNIVYGMLKGIRSSRRLEEALEVRLDFRWLSSGMSIDHSTFAKFRNEKSAQIKQLFVQTGLIAQELGWTDFKKLCFDGTTIRASNRRTGTRTPEDLAKWKQALQGKFDELHEKLAAADIAESERFENRKTVEDQQLRKDLADVQRTQQQVDAALAELKKIEQAGTTIPKRIPITDPKSRLSRSKNNGFDVNHTATVLCDEKTGLIVDADILDGVSEDKNLPHVLDRFEESVGQSPDFVLADGAFGTGENLSHCDSQDVQLVTPMSKSPGNPAHREDLSQPVLAADRDRLPSKARKVDGEEVLRLTKEAFIYDADEDAYFCPQGERLPFRSKYEETRKGVTRQRSTYRSDAATCEGCPLAAMCMGKAKIRTVRHDAHEALRLEHADRMSTDEFKAMYKQRQGPGERPFGIIKNVFGMRQFLTRGSATANEFTIASFAYNMLMMIGLSNRANGPPEIKSAQHA